MPWWAYLTALEGLAWEQPWIPRVEIVEVKDREVPDIGSAREATADDFAGMGLVVTEMG